MSHFSFSTTCSSPTASASPTYSSALPTSSTLSPHSSLSAPSTNHRRTTRWAPLSDHGLPRSSSTSLRSRRLAASPGATPSPGTTPGATPSPSPRLPAADRPSAAPDPTRALPRRPAAPRASSPKPDEKERGDKTALRRLGRSVGRGLRRCSDCFRRRPMGPEEVEEIPGPRHWSEY